MAYGDSESGDLSNKTVTFKGFSSRADKQNFKLYDFEVAKQGLINRLSVRKGERVENPEFGTIIYDAIFEPFTDDLKDAIVEDITANLLTLTDIPKKIQSKDFPEEIDIRGEVFIQKSDFEKLKEKFANPRNAASGSLRQKNPEDTKKIPLNFIAYTFGFEQGLKQKNQSDYLKKLNSEKQI